MLEHPRLLKMKKKDTYTYCYHIFLLIYVITYIKILNIVTESKVLCIKYKVLKLSFAKGSFTSSKSSKICVLVLYLLLL